MTEQADKYREASTQMNRLAELDDEEAEVKDGVEEQLDVTFKDEKLTGMFFSPYIMSEHEEITKLSTSLNINATEARKQLNVFPKEYRIEEQSIPDIVRKMRKSRREVKGSHRNQMSKAIDTLIDAYADHLQKCIKSITWLNDYTVPLSKMRYNEKDLSKLNKMKDVELRRETIDSLCKYWEAELKQENMAYSKEYSELHKEMRLAKKGFRNAIAKITDQSITKTKKQRLEGEILKSVCDNPKGISAKNIHEIMPSDLHKMSSPNTISKSLKKLEVVLSHGLYFKFSGEIKKNLWAYTAAFIDSDGYITLDRNMNPRVGLIATGSRGRAFMEEMHKSIGFGRMHLDQKSPQQTRLIQRLNFYSQDEVTDLLTKCLPHFRLKKGNAELLLELIRMKKGYKKTDWYKPRCDEIFKLMKWENHKDHVGYDWLKEGIYLTDITKLQKNCKMSTMDGLENHESILKSQKTTMAAVVAQENQRMNRMANPSMRVEEENVNQKVGTIDMDMDIEGDCCSQLKVKVIEYYIDLYEDLLEDMTWEELVEDLVMEGMDRDFYHPTYELHMEDYADWVNEQDCEYLANDYLNSQEAIDIKIIEEYNSCLTSNMGDNFNNKWAMLKSQKTTMMAQKNKVMNRMANPTMRVEEENVNQKVGTIDMDMDIEGDCCSQLKVKVIENTRNNYEELLETRTWEELVRELILDGDKYDVDTYFNTYKATLELEMEGFENWINRVDCEYLVNHYLHESQEDELPMIEEYNLCLTSGMGGDFNTKNAMLKAIIKQQERTFIIDSYEDPYTEEQIAQGAGETVWHDKSVVMAVTAKELGIDEDSDMEEIEEQLLSWLNSKVGFVQGYTWYEITADGKKRDWLNPNTRYDQT